MAEGLLIGVILGAAILIIICLYYIIQLRKHPQNQIFYEESFRKTMYLGLPILVGFEFAYMYHPILGILIAIAAISLYTLIKKTSNKLRFQKLAKIRGYSR